MTIKSQYSENDVPAVYGKDITFLQLPFPNLRLSWNNGNAHAERTSGAKHFGGWARGSTNILEDIQSLSLDAPAGLVESEWVSQDGKTYSAYAARNVYAAPIAAKDDWWEEFDPRRSKNVKRHRLDFLVLLGVYNQTSKVIEAYAPTVLSATGFAASAILKAFRAFEKDTKPARDIHAPGVPAMFFYVPVGTFGDKRITEPAGESTYVPCQYMHSTNGEWSESNLLLLYVGDEAASYMLELRNNAEAWLQDTRAHRAKEFTETTTVPAGSWSTDDINTVLAASDNPFEQALT